MLAEGWRGSRPGTLRGAPMHIEDDLDLAALALEDDRDLADVQIVDDLNLSSEGS